ncbi:hypothetical protein CCHR01_17526 [Colletotrichum chrysophilum]|uniref:Uncharacterized protein n=1 Tax=Colletotrichum chrysophilum TaxID=1836956 RepID=A0AAD9E907_9PEZI|nr:hypothetical protein CCHR01_17526 [Colletotrichum chrysophilum]
MFPLAPFPTLATDAVQKPAFACIHVERLEKEPINLFSRTFTFPPITAQLAAAVKAVFGQHLLGKATKGACRIR